MCLDHNSNVQPWLVVAERTGAVGRWVDLDPAVEQIAVHSRAAERPRPSSSRSTIDASSTCRASSLSGTSTRRGATSTPVDASQRPGLGDEGALRIGMAPYNRPEDADRLLNCVADFFADA